jgi:endo-1,4-beta-xylanase
MLKFLLTVIFAFCLQSNFSSAADAVKILGCATDGSILDQSNFAQYFVAMTPESNGEWTSIEPVQNQRDWSQMDFDLRFTTDSTLAFREHVLFYPLIPPPWIGGLSASAQVSAVKAFLADFASRGYDLKQIVVANEVLHGQPPPYAAAFGGAGATGKDWLINLYSLVRQYFPGVQLGISEYDVESYPDSVVPWMDGGKSLVPQYISLCNLLKSRGLLDFVCLEGHYLESTPDSQITAALNMYEVLGLPVYISELTVAYQDDRQQLARYQDLFPLLYTHPVIAGITLWGYTDIDAGGPGSSIPGLPHAYLYSTSTNSERPALTWLKRYFQSFFVNPTWAQYQWKNNLNLFCENLSAPTPTWAINWIKAHRLLLYPSGSAWYSALVAFINSTAPGQRVARYVSANPFPPGP